jgi:hypothetical protein
VAGEGFAQRRPGGAQLGGGRIHAAELFGEGEGAFGLGPIREEPAGLPAQQVAIVARALLRSTCSSERVLSEVDVEQDAATARAAAGNLSLESAPQHGGARAG